MFAFEEVADDIIESARHHPKTKIKKSDGYDEPFRNVVAHFFIRIEQETHSSSVGGMNCSNLDFQYIF